MSINDFQIHLAKNEWIQTCIEWAIKDYEQEKYPRLIIINRKIYNIYRINSIDIQYLFHIKVTKKMGFILVGSVKNKEEVDIDEIKKINIYTAMFDNDACPPTVCTKPIATYNFQNLQKAMNYDNKQKTFKPELFKSKIYGILINKDTKIYSFV